MWQALRPQLIILMTGAIAAGAVLLLAPEGRGSPGKTIKSLVMLSMTLLFWQALRGLPSAVRTTVSLPAAKEDFEETVPLESVDAIAKAAEVRLGHAIEEQIMFKFGKEVGVSVSLDTEKADQIKIKSVTLAMADEEKTVVADYLSLLLDCPVTVTDHENNTPEA